MTALNLQNFRVKIRWFAEFFLWIIHAISALMLAASALAFVLNVYMRYIAGAPLAWPEEFSLYIVVLMVYLMQCRLEFKNESLGIGIIDPLLAKSKPLRIFVALFHIVVVIVVFGILLNVGQTVVQQQIRFGALSPIMRIPMATYFNLINICFILIIVFWVIRLFTHNFDEHDYGGN